MYELSVVLDVNQDSELADREPQRLISHNRRLAGSRGKYLLFVTLLRPSAAITLPPQSCRSTRS